MSLRTALVALWQGNPAAERAVPRGAQSARSVGFVAVILAFFAVLILALSLAAGRLAHQWQAELADAATLQVFADEGQMETQARAALNVLRTTPGIREVRMVDLAEQQALLKPWLGADVALDSLALPLMIEVQLDRTVLNRQSLDLRLAAEAPGAVFDDHAAWRAPLVVTADRLRLFALGCLGLLALAFAAMLGLAAHAAVAAGAQAVQTLRLVGAKDSYITDAFTRRFTRAAVLGAGVGTLAGLGLIALLPRASEPGFFLVGIGLAGREWLLPLLVPAGAGLVAWVATGRSVRRQLRRWS